MFKVYKYVQQVMMSVININLAQIFHLMYCVYEWSVKNDEILLLNIRK